MSQVFALVAAASIRATILLVLAAGIAVLLRNRAAAVRHALWTAAVAVSLSFPLLSAMLPSLGVRNPISVTGLASAARSAAAKVNGAALRPLFDVREIFTPAPSNTSRAAQIRQALLLVWLAGLLLGVLRMLRSSVAVIRLRRSATIVSDVRIVGLTCRKVLLVEADGVTAPGTAGIVRPTIFLPHGAAEWGATRIRATLAHECAHIDRRDCLTKLLADIAVALYWFHPLVWYARRRMITESERACDDQVLHHGVRPDRYASVLVETVRASLHQRKGEPAGVLSMARPSELEARLVSILDPSRARGGMSSRAALVTASISIGAAVLISAPHLDAAPAERPTGSRMTTAELRLATAKPIAASHSLQISTVEPDRRNDSIAGPLSERLAVSAEVLSAARNTAALRGPDSVLARMLYAQLSRSASWEGDLVGDRSAWALSRQRGGLLVEPLIESLADHDWRVRAYAAWALTYSGASRAVPPLIALFSDPNWRVRAMAAYAIDGIGEESAAPAMAGAARDEAWQVRVAAVHFIGMLHSPKYQSLLQTALADRHIAVRQAAAEAVSKPLSNQ